MKMHVLRTFILVALIALIAALVGCGNQRAGAGGAAKSNITLNGAGASFPYPIYAVWANKYHEITGTRINYQSIGSGGGIQQIKAGTVDFGASDAPLTTEELDEAGLIQFPMIIGGVVPVVNVEGIDSGELKLTPDTMAKIFLGDINKWNDPAIKSANPNLDLPNQDITVVHRSDGSGTTWIFTDYLSKVSPDWKSRVGTGKAVNWPVGVGGKGNEGVANYVQRTNGSIGYVEFAYALQNDMAHASLKNQAGNYVNPSIETFQAAAANADWENAPGFYVVLTNEPGADSWPITGASYILIHREIKDPEVGKAILAFFGWAFDNGDKMATERDYVPVPDNVVKLVEEKWANQVTASGESIWPPEE